MSRPHSLSLYLLLAITRHILVDVLSMCRRGACEVLRIPRSGSGKDVRFIVVRRSTHFVAFCPVLTPFWRRHRHIRHNDDFNDDDDDSKCKDHIIYNAYGEYVRLFTVTVTGYGQNGRAERQRARPF